MMISRVRQANTNYAGRYLCVIEWNTKDEPVQVVISMLILVMIMIANVVNAINNVIIRLRFKCR